jgi:hypothetical protein
MPLTSNYHWQVGLISVVVGSVNIRLTVSLHAILDSGTSLTYIPSDEYNQIITEITRGKSCQLQYG